MVSHSAAAIPPSSPAALKPSTRASTHTALPTTTYTTSGGCGGPSCRRPSAWATTRCFSIPTSRYEPIRILLYGALANHTLVSGLGNDQKAWPAAFPDSNVGLLYLRGPVGGGAHWVVSEAKRRLEALLRGEVLGLPEQRGVSQLSFGTRRSSKTCSRPRPSRRSRHRGPRAAPLHAARRQRHLCREARAAAARGLGAAYRAASLLCEGGCAAAAVDVAAAACAATHAVGRPASTTLSSRWRSIVWVHKRERRPWAVGPVER